MPSTTYLASTTVEHLLSIVEAVRQCSNPKRLSPPSAGNAVKKQREIPYGFLLITTDPLVEQGEPGAAFDLVEARLFKSAWPLYRRTPNRAAIGPGALLAFYVGGKRSHRGEIVATAKVLGKESVRDRKAIDPRRFVTAPPDQIIRLDAVNWLQKPIVVNEVVHRLSFCPKNRKKWGVVMMGGARALIERDWQLLFDEK